MSSLYKRKGSGCCVAPGCSMRKGTNNLSKVKLFKFPKNEERRQQWEVAVHRENWKSTSHSQLCNLHFISGEPSKDPSHPDYVPSIFNNKKKKPSNDSVARYERRIKRSRGNISNSEEISNLQTDGDTVPEESNAPEKKDSCVMTELSMQHIENLEKEIEAHKSLNTILQESAKKNMASEVLKNTKMLEFYTKLPGTAFFYGLLAFITNNWKPVTKTILEQDEQLLLILMKLRLGLLNEDLAYRFSVGKSTVSNLFREWIARMAFVLSSFIRQPSQKTIKKNLPKAFVESNIKNISAIIDCSEIFIERPFNLDARAKTYSNYKHHNTVKFLISCTPCGGISFISKAYGGRISDKEITKKCGFLDTIRPNDIILADRGFKIEELVALKNATVILPSSTKGKKQLSGESVTRSRNISRLRIHIERCIGRMKYYRILQYTWPITFLSYSSDGTNTTGDNILAVIAALCNISRTPILN